MEGAALYVSAGSLTKAFRLPGFWDLHVLGFPALGTKLLGAKWQVRLDAIGDWGWKGGVLLAHSWLVYELAALRAVRLGVRHILKAACAVRVFDRHMCEALRSARACQYVVAYLRQSDQIYMKIWPAGDAEQACRAR